MAGLQSSPISNQNQYSSNSSQFARDRMSALGAELNSVPNKTNGEILVEKLQEAGVTISSQNDLDRLNNTLDNQFGTGSSNTIYASDELPYNFSFKTPTPTFDLPGNQNFSGSQFRPNYNNSFQDISYSPNQSKSINLDVSDQVSSMMQDSTQQYRAGEYSRNIKKGFEATKNDPSSNFDSLYAERQAKGEANQAWNKQVNDSFNAAKNSSSAQWYDLHNQQIANGNANAYARAQELYAQGINTSFGAAKNSPSSQFYDLYAGREQKGRINQQATVAYEKNKNASYANFDSIYAERIAQGQQNQEARRLQEEQARQQEYDRQQKYTKNPLLLNQTLANLIESGADAQANLFEVTIFAGYEGTEFSSLEAQAIQKNLTFRINNFNAPAKQLQSQDLPYQTAVYKKIVPGSSLTRQLDFNIRLDYNYQIYWYLHRIFAGDSFGNFDLNLLNKNSQDYVCTIQVKALSPKQVKLGNIPSAAEEEAYKTAYITSPAQFEISYSWTFFDCYLIQIPQVSFGYEQSGSITPTFSFIFGMMTEGIGETGLVSTPLKDEAFSLLNRDKKLNSEE